jgi:hypothetical protein
VGITPEQNKAAGEFVELIAAKIGDGRSIHSETAIAACARLSGSLLLRSFNFQLEALEPGTALLSEEANQKGPELINTMLGFLSAVGVPADQLSVNQQAGRGEAPRLDVGASLALLQSDALKIGERYGLQLDQSAQAIALATGFIVKECIPQIGAGVALNVAMFGFVEGSKTIPPKLGNVPVEKVNAKPWYKFW